YLRKVKQFTSQIFERKLVKAKFKIHLISSHSSRKNQMPAIRENSYKNTIICKFINPLESSQCHRFFLKIFNLKASEISAIQNDPSLFVQKQMHGYFACSQ
uniref:Uncharacterized protein n=1 Tax=Meloidogyne incognita TaxID=6306 RepID=A0A914MXG5_MELIC